ncbi:hypothetical protein EXN66_Car008164 [Channa argus]|uniref:Chromatin target of PRMT1 protein C-terminal domain-containing protein n=1 Tax=Channa argus TaxID=215402 RepID=A0A6G1PR86_CHAAH|nr:hypothetical protein EXN66_Car008164 [Channa argus]
MNGRGNLRTRFCQHGLSKKANSQTLAAGRHLNLQFPRGGGSASRGRGQSRQDIPTKKQLDAQLDDYMSMSKSRLDEQLEDYMSKSRRRLDAELDDYMLMAGDLQLHWD